MKLSSIPILLVLLAMTSVLTLAGHAQQSGPAPSFTISANAITLPSGGSASIPITVTSVNGFVGQVDLVCTNPNPPAGVKEPNCGNYGPESGPVALTANETATGALGLTSAEPLPVHQASGLTLLGHGGGASWALAGVLMLGIGVRRRRVRRSALWSSRLLLAVGMLIGLTGLSACGSGPVTLTPGVYAYTLTATSSNQSIPSLSASTTVNVTVPPGVIVQPTIGPGPI